MTCCGRNTPIRSRRGGRKASMSPTSSTSSKRISRTSASGAHGSSGARSRRRPTPGDTDVRCARSASRAQRRNAATAGRGSREAPILNTQASSRNRMRGPRSDYAAPPIYLSPEPSGPRPGVRFSRQELFQLGVALLALSAALTLANAMALRNSYAASELPLRVGLWFSSALVAVASGVGLHEISHKIVAQRYGHWAEFRYSLRGLAMSFVFAFFGFLIGAPGATMVSGNVTRDQNGRISAAGPVSNLVIGTAFMLAAAAIVRTSSLANLPAIFVTIILVNAWYLNVILAGFNMIPILPFDGSKVWAWNKAVYAGILVLALSLYLSGVYLGLTGI